MAGQRFESLSIFLFFVTTSVKEACKAILTIHVKEEQWEERKQNHLNGDCYIDLQKIEPLSKKDLLAKIQDQANGFKCVARLPDDLFQELNDKRRYMNRSRLSDHNKELVNLAFSEKENSDAVLKKLGLW